MVLQPSWRSSQRCRALVGCSASTLRSNSSQSHLSWVEVGWPCQIWPRQRWLKYNLRTDFVNVISSQPGNSTGVCLEWGWRASRRWDHTSCDVNGAVEQMTSETCDVLCVACTQLFVLSLFDVQPWFHLNLIGCRLAVCPNGGIPLLKLSNASCVQARHMRYTGLSG